MKKILWKLLEWSDNNWGYSTPLQKRFKIGDKCRISQHKTAYNPFDVSEEVVIIETGRHDYLVKNNNLETAIVYQFELA